MFNVVFFLEIFSGIANGVDLDQTASGFALFAYAILSETLVYKVLGHLPYSVEEFIQSKSG